MEVVLDLITKVEGSQKEIGKLKAEMAALRKEADGSRKELEKLLSGKTPSGGNDGVAKVATLKTQLREAKLEAQALLIQAEKGLIPQDVAEAALQRAADLTEQLDDFNASIQALNPEAKFNSIVSLGQIGVASFQAIAGAAQLFGDESESTQKAILKMQAVLNFTQGLNQIFGMRDALKNVGAALGITTALKRTDTVVTVENTGAVVGGTTAQVAAGGAMKATSAFAVVQTAVVGGLTTAWNVLKAVLITNPLGPILILVGLIGAEIVKMIENLNKGTQSLKDFRDAAKAEEERLTRIVATQFDAVISSARNRFQAEKDIAIANSKTAEEAERKTREISQREDTYVKGILERQMRLGFALTSEQQSQYNEIAENNRQARLTQLKENDELQKEIAQKEKEAREKARQEAEKFQKEFEDSIKQLTEQSRQALLNTLSGGDRIKQEKAFAEQQVKALRDKITELGKQTQGAGFKLTAEQEAQFKLLGDAIERDYVTKVNNLEKELARNRIDLLGKTTETVIKLYNAEFTEREKKLRELGASDAEIERVRVAGLRDVLNVQFNEQIDKAASAERVKIQLYADSNLTREKQEEEIQRRLLQLDVNTAQQKLRLRELLARFGFQTDSTQIQQLELNLKQAKGALDKFEKDIRDKQDAASSFSFSKLFADTLNISDEDRALFDEALAGIVNSLGSAFSSINDEKQRLNEQEIQRNNEFISSLESRISATQSALQKELDAQKRGYANNVDAKKRELALLESEKRKALEKDKALQKEKQKLAREEAIASSIAQTAGLIESSVNIFKSATKQDGLLGVVLGLAGAAALVAGFLQIKNRIQSATQFEKGGWINGASHKGGGVKYISTSPNSGVKELEGDEFVVRKAVARRPINARVLEAMNNDRMSGLSRNDIALFLKGTGVRVSDEAYSAANVVSNHLQFKQDNKGVESRLERIEGVLSSIEGTISSDGESYLSDGSKVVRKGKTIRVVRK